MARVVTLFYTFQIYSKTYNFKKNEDFPKCSIIKIIENVMAGHDSSVNIIYVRIHIL